MKRYMKGLNPIAEEHGSTHSLELTQFQFDNYKSSNYFIADRSISRVKTLEEIEAFEKAATNYTIRKAAKLIRDRDLANLTVEVEGNVFQTRPSDEPNFRLVIGSLAHSNYKTEWILADNTVAIVMKKDLEVAYATGIGKAAAVYDVYKEVLKTL